MPGFRNCSARRAALSPVSSGRAFYGLAALHDKSFGSMGPASDIVKIRREVPAGVHCCSARQVDLIGCIMRTMIFLALALIACTEAPPSIGRPVPREEPPLTYVLPLPRAP